jgi:hypothetical protein
VVVKYFHRITFVKTKGNLFLEAIEDSPVRRDLVRWGRNLVRWGMVRWGMSPGCSALVVR